MSCSCSPSQPPDICEVLHLSFAVTGQYKSWEVQTAGLELLEWWWGTWWLGTKVCFEQALLLWLYQWAKYPSYNPLKRFWKLMVRFSVFLQRQWFWRFLFHPHEKYRETLLKKMQTWDDENPDHHNPGKDSEPQTGTCCWWESEMA